MQENLNTNQSRINSSKPFALIGHYVQKLRSGAFFTLALSTALLIYFLSQNLVHRSLWLDESMLLANFFNDKNLSLLKPLGLYDQAAPPLVIIWLKLSVTLLKGDIVAIRYSILGIFLCGLMYALYGASKAFRIKTAVLISLFTLSSFSILYYTTEIKNYGFEITGTYILIGWFLLYSCKKEKNLKWSDLLILLAGLAVGFSTFFVFLSIISIITIISFINKKTNRKHLGILIILMAIGIVYKILLSNYSTYQLGNYFDVYTHQEGLHQVVRVYELLGKIPIIAFLFSIAYFIFAFYILKNQITANSYYKGSLMFFLALTNILFVGLAAASGLYPVYGDKQLMWVLPIVITLLSITLTLNKTDKYYSSSIIMLITLGFAYLFIHNSLPKFKIQNQDYTANNSLYNELSHLDSGNVLVYFGAQPSLEVYTKILPNLSKHHYIGQINNQSGHLIQRQDFISHFPKYINSTPGAWGSMTYFRAAHNYDIYSKWAVQQTAGLDDFYILISHIDEIRQDSFFKSLNERDCKITSIFSDKGVQILKSNCAKGPRGL